MKKLRRAQPRSATPPVKLTSSDGDIQILALDDALTLNSDTWRTTTLSPIFLQLLPGLQITLASKKVNKRRFALIIVAPASTAANTHA